MQKVELHITSDPRYLRVVRAAVEQICQLAGYTRLDTSKIVLAVDEACSNVIRHAYNGDTGQPIVVSCDINSHDLIVEVVDYGDHVDVESIKPRPLDELRPGGLGVHLIKSVMDRVQYSNLETIGNRLLMQKARPKGKRSEPQDKQQTTGKHHRPAGRR